MKCLHKCGKENVIKAIRYRLNILARLEKFLLSPPVSFAVSPSLPSLLRNPHSDLNMSISLTWRLHDLPIYPARTPIASYRLLRGRYTRVTIRADRALEFHRRVRLSGAFVWRMGSHEYSSLFPWCSSYVWRHIAASIRSLTKSPGRCVRELLKSQPVRLAEPPALNTPHWYADKPDVMFSLFFFFNGNLRYVSCVFAI